MTAEEFRNKMTELHEHIQQSIEIPTDSKFSRLFLRKKPFTQHKLIKVSTPIHKDL